MRKVLTMAALALLMAGCSNEENGKELNPVDPNAPVAIRLTQMVAGITTKAPITAGSKVSGIVVMMDVATDAAEGTHNWGSFVSVDKNEITEKDGTQTLTKRANTAGATFIAGTTQDITLAPTLYYDNSTDKKKAHITGVVPAGTISGETVTFGTKDGLQDVMSLDGDVDAGTQDSPAQSIALNFQHRTTQLTFAAKYTVVAGNAGAWKGAAVSVKNITVKSAGLPASVKLSNGAVTWDKGDFSVPGIITSALTGTVANVSSSIMIQPSSDITIDVVLSVGGKETSFVNIPVMDSKTTTNKLDAKAGFANLVTLTINEPQTPADESKPIEVKATVAEWQAGNGGTAEIK